MDSVHALLHQIAANHDFARLERLREPAVWGEWSQEARHALGLLFAEYAASSLAGDLLEETFTLAQSLAPDCPLLAIRRATMLSARYKDVKALEHAHLAFQQAHTLDPEGSLISWETWADTLRHLATLKKESKHAQEALTYYKKARQATNHKERLGRIYYHMALCHYLLGELFEEVSEYARALNILEQAKAFPFDAFSTQFLHSKVLAALGWLLDRHDLPQTAIQATLENLKDLEKKFAPDETFECHRFIAAQAANLYKHSYDTTFFSLAYHHFTSAIKQVPQPNCRIGHLECAQFLLFAGKVCREIDVLEKAQTHFEKSGINTEQASELLLQWAETEILFGSQTDQLQLLYSAQKKVDLYLAAHPSDPRALSLHANILTALAQYFTDASRYEAALSILNETLDKHPTLPFLWMSAAEAYIELGELT